MLCLRYQPFGFIGPHGDNATIAFPVDGLNHLLEALVIAHGMTYR